MLNSFTSSNSSRTRLFNSFIAAEQTKATNQKNPTQNLILLSIPMNSTSSTQKSCLDWTRAWEHYKFESLYDWTEYKRESKKSNEKLRRNYETGKQNEDGKIHFYGKFAFYSTLRYMPPLMLYFGLPLKALSFSPLQSILVVGYLMMAMMKCNDGGERRSNRWTWEGEEPRTPPYSVSPILLSRSVPHVWRSDG